LWQQPVIIHKTIINVDKRPKRSLEAQSLMTFHFLHFQRHIILNMVGGVEHKFEKNRLDFTIQFF